MNPLIELDTKIFWWINQHHCAPLDWLLWTASQSWSWALVLIGVMGAVTLRKERRRWWIVLLGIGLCFLLSDRISVMCFKDVVCRLRPCHALEGVRMFHTGKGGLYGFVSSHAANVASLAMFLALRYKQMPRSSKHYWLGWLMGIWALLVCYSRPYLGKHYPGDVVCGAILGLGIGALVWFVSTKVDALLEKKEKKE